MESTPRQSVPASSPVFPGPTGKDDSSPYNSPSELQGRIALLDGQELRFSELVQRAEEKGYLEPEYWYAFAGRGRPSSLTMEEWAFQVMELGERLLVWRTIRWIS